MFYIITDAQGRIVQNGETGTVADLLPIIDENPGYRIFNAPDGNAINGETHYVNIATGALTARPVIPAPTITNQRVQFATVPPGLTVDAFDQDYGGYSMTRGPVAVPGNIWLTDNGTFRLLFRADFPYRDREVTQLFKDGISPILDETWISISPNGAERAAHVVAYRNTALAILHERMRETWAAHSSNNPWLQESLTQASVQAYAYLIDPAPAGHMEIYPILQDARLGPTIEDRATTIINMAAEVSAISMDLTIVYQSSAFDIGEAVELAHVNTILAAFHDYTQIIIDAAGQSVPISRPA